MHRSPAAGRAKPDLRPGEKCYRRRKLVRVRHVMRLGTQADLSLALQGMGFGGAAEHCLYREGESDYPAWDSRTGSSYLGDGAAVAIPTRPSGVVARLLSLCAASRSAASGAGAAARTRGQANGTTLPTAYPSDGSWENHPAMDRARGALVSLAVGFRLSATQAREGAVSCHEEVGEDASRSTPIEHRLAKRKPVWSVH